MYRVAVVILSDRASRGEREDKCLPVFRELLPRDLYSIVTEKILPDDRVIIETTLRNLVKEKYHLIFTSGGTGCAPSDVTPDVTVGILDRPTPGLDEAIRRYSESKSRYAVFSRALSGVAGNSYIINLPGSPKAVREILEFVIPILEHPIRLIAGKVKDCQQELAENDNV
ncbi:MAG: MogA/MoaB family molybdenum cofactor biosynthesis protein [candidate division Zixibacteria bacterium]|nr:MogA/MoaB family molybdenum cofactor biosynthesis protein [candidate division Zixibacteria bacterium]